MNYVKKFLSNIKSLDLILILSFFLYGGFNEFVSCVITVVVSAFLIAKILKKRCFVLKINIVSVMILLLVLGYLFTSFYAVDKGMAVLGFLKFLPVLLFALFIMQDDESRVKAIEKLPFYAFVIGLISVIGMFIPIIGDYFVVAERLGGVFQYPNTFAIFLLVGELLVISKETYKPMDYIMTLTLIVTILLTGSRTVFILSILSNLLMIFLKKGIKIKVIALAVVVALALAVLTLYPFLKDHDFFGRFYALSFSESTFAGRLLYYFDALPLILKNPFGYGYMGYYYLQQSVQTGLYSIKFIHNDLLQILLDIGWIPAILFIITVVKSIFSNVNKASYKIVLITIFVHSLFDFDLQFVSMFFVFLLFLDVNGGKRIEITKRKGIVIGVISLISCVSIYFAIALSFAHFGLYEAANVLYPYNTQNKIELLINEEDLEKQNKIADEIIEQNQYISVAYSAKAHYAFAQGDFEKLMEYKNYIFEIAPFAYEEYEEYAYMLIQGIYLYSQVGDMQSANICYEELLNTKTKLESLNDKTSYLGKIIVDQVNTKLSEDVEEFINRMDMMEVTQ